MAAPIINRIRTAITSTMADTDLRYGVEYDKDAGHNPYDIERQGTGMGGAQQAN